MKFGQYDSSRTKASPQVLVLIVHDMNLIYNRKTYNSSPQFIFSHSSSQNQKQIWVHVSGALS